MNRLLENEINERKRIEDELAEQSAESAVAAERSRLARELHDAVTQTLFSASLIAEALPVVWEHNPQEGQELLDELRNLSRGALAEMRTLLLELRPAVLVEASLEDLLRQLSEAAMGREGIPVKVDVQGKATLPCDVHIAFYRVAQEALNNVLKHARATNVEIDLIYSPNMKDDQDTNEFESVTLKIRDDGRGFEPDTVPSDHMGLVIMQERAQSIGADFEVNTKFGKGTTIQLRWYHNRQEATGEI
jgi:signal transduction histidine kinase